MNTDIVTRGDAAGQPPARLPVLGGSPSVLPWPDQAAGAGANDASLALYWDGDLSRDELNRLSPLDKQARLGASLRRKLAIIESAARDPAGISDASLPTNRTRLREWEDRANKLWPWSDRRAERADGPHAAALARFDLAVSTLRAKSRKGAQASWEEQLAAKDAMISALTRQNAALIVQLATRGPALDDVRR